MRKIFCFFGLLIAVAEAEAAKVKRSLRNREGEGISGAAIAGIVAASVILLLLAYVLYRYLTWVPRTRAKSPTRRGSLSTSVSEASTGEDPKRLFAAIKTKA